MSKYIIIGGNGFLGSFLKTKFIDSESVVSETYNEFINNANNYNNSVIFICATPTSNKNIINDLKKLNNDNNTFILFSSAVVYDGLVNETSESESELLTQDRLNFKESDYSVNTDNKLSSSDDYVNLARENEHEFLKLVGKKIIIRLGTLYGFSPYLNATRGINRMIYYILINNEIIINNPSLKKSFTSLNDLYNGIKVILNSEVEDKDVYNISSFDITIKELGEYISKKYDVEIKYNILDKKEYSFNLNTEKCKKLGWKPESTLETIEDDITNNFDLIKEVKYSLNKNTDIIIWRRKEDCRVCKSYNLSKVLNLNNQPPPNRLSDVFWKYINFPLELNMCNSCYNSQLSGVMNPIIMYKNYSYLSGTATTMRQYFDYFVETYVDKSKKNVLDIACNDGALLDSFKKFNFNTYGVDPASNIVRNIKDHKIYEGFFDTEIIKMMDIKFDIVTAFNVFAHVDDIYDFLNNIDKITNDDSDIYIQTSQCDMIINNEFDTIYHEHLSFFTIKSILEMSKHSIFKLQDVYIVGVHGNSYLFLFKKCVKDSDTVMKRYNYENNFKMYNSKTYLAYANNIYKWKDDFINLLKSKNIVIGVGASAKGITILNFIGKENIKIDCIIDENPLKVNKMINSVDIKINPFSYLLRYEKERVSFILFAWNFRDELIKKIRNINPEGNYEFINLFPLETIN